MQEALLPFITANRLVRRKNPNAPLKPDLSFSLTNTTKLCNSGGEQQA